MWPDLLRGMMGNLSGMGNPSSYGMQPAPTSLPSDPQLGNDLAAANRNLGRYGTPPPPMNPNPSVDEMIQIAQRFGAQPKTAQQITPDAPPQTPADATRVVKPQSKGGQQQSMLNMLMQHLLSANGAPPYMSDVAKSPQGWQDIYKYYHPTLTPGQPLPLRMR